MAAWRAAVYFRHHLQLASCLICPPRCDLVACTSDYGRAVQDANTIRATTRVGKGANGQVWKCISAELPGCVLKEGPLNAILGEAEKMAPLRHPALLRPFAVLKPGPNSEAASKGNAYLVLPELGPSLKKMLAAK